jgi:hypothetical protein
MTQDEIDDIKEKMHFFTGRVATLSNDLLQETDDKKKDDLEKEIDRVKNKITELSELLPIQGSAGAPKRLRKIIPAGMFQAERSAHPEETDEQTYQRLVKEINSGISGTVKNVVPSIKKSLEFPKPKVKSSQEKLTDLQIKRLQKESREQLRANLPAFKFPSISKDTATSFVIGSIIVTFILLAGISTKFSKLWALSFSSPTGGGTGDFQGSGPGSSEGTKAWGIPDYFHNARISA